MSVLSGKGKTGRPLVRGRGHCQRGAVLLAVVAVIGLGASVMLLNAVTRVRPSIRTEIAAAAALRQARDALIGFAIINGRLPGPARPQTPTGTSFGGFFAGVEDPARTVGVLPWATLGLPETDGRGRRYSYRVTTAFTTPPPTPPTPLFDGTTPGDITILDRLGGSTIAAQVPAVIVCHGINGFNAWLPSGAQMPAASNADENANDTADTIFVSQTHSATFDDTVVWLDRTLLIDRLTRAGRLTSP